MPYLYLQPGSRRRCEHPKHGLRLKRRDERHEYTRVEFDYYLLTRLKLKSAGDSASAFFVVGLNHRCLWIGLSYGVNRPSNASGLLPPMPEWWIVPARWRVRNPIF